MNFAAVVWLILMILFLVCEAATVSLVSMWFACGALAAMIVKFPGGQCHLADFCLPAGFHRAAPAAPASGPEVFYTQTVPHQCRLCHRLPGLCH